MINGVSRSLPKIERFRADHIIQVHNADRQRLLFNLGYTVEDAGFMCSGNRSTYMFRLEDNGKEAGTGLFRLHFWTHPDAQLDVVADFGRIEWLCKKEDSFSHMFGQMTFLHDILGCDHFARIGNNEFYSLFLWSTAPGDRTIRLVNLWNQIIPRFLGKSYTELSDAHPELTDQQTFEDAIITAGVPVFFSGTKDEVIPVLKPFDLAFCKAQTIFPAGRNFDRIFAEAVETSGLDPEKHDPRRWALDTGNKRTLAEQMDLMSIEELQSVFVRLISGDRPVIESSAHFAKSPYPLQDFVESLASSATEIVHHCKQPPARLTQYTELLMEERQLGSEGDPQYIERLNGNIASIEEYLIFMRELALRWE